MDLNDTELNYIYSETDSYDASNKSNKSLFYFKQFSIVRASEGFSIRDILYWKTHSTFPNVLFLLLFFLTEIMRF